LLIFIFTLKKFFMILKKLLFFSTICAAIFLLINGCKTADGKLTKLGKGYQNVTGRYNAYYHAQLKLIKAQQTIDAQFKDNYTSLLPIFPHAANQDSNLVKADVDEAIKKCAMNIELHRPSNWADDTYLLLGQAEFLRCKREKASQTFAYIVAKYNPNKEKSAMNKDELAKNKKQLAKEKAKAAKEKKKTTAKKKKQATKKKKTTAKKKKQDKSKKGNSKSSNTNKTNTDLNANSPTPAPKPEPENTPDSTKQEKPKKYFLKHRPIHYQAMLWLAKSYIETKNYDDAGLYLRLLAEDGRVPYRLRGEVQAVMAHLFIQQENYPKAIDALTKAIKKTKKRKLKTRYTYVLAQLQEKQGNYAAAFEQYRKVRKLAPSYEMEFNAQLNAATTAAKGGDEGYNHQLALRRMLNDGKNEEFKDQILFAMAQNQLRDGDKIAGIASLRQSMSSSNGGNQKAETALLLADLYYEQTDYVNAYIFYDTTCQLLNKTDERYTAAQNQKNKLNLFAINSLNLARQDTLLSIGMMSFDEQKAYIQKLQKEELAAKTAPKNNSKNAKPAPENRGRPTLAEMAKANITTQANPNAKNTQPSTASGQPVVSDNNLILSTFPLYNPAMQKKGEKDFEKRYGQRAWADNWRRSKRAGAENKKTEENTIAQLQPMTEQEVKDMLTKIGVPQDDKQKEDLNNKIAISLFNIGLAYREQLDMNDKAIETFENLLSRFPKSTKRLETLYMLYNCYSDKKNQNKAEYYKNLIVAEFPNSDIAKSVKNPNFLNENAQKEKDLSNFYQQSYELVRKTKFEEAAKQIADVARQFGESHTYRARFALLEAMVVGGTKGEKDYLVALKAVSTSFPNTNEDKKAKEIVAVLTQSSTTTNNNAANNSTANSKFVVNANSRHYVMVVFADKKTNTNPLLTPIAEYNGKNYTNEKFTANGFEITADKLPAISISKFKNQDDALRYLAAVKAEQGFLGDNPPAHELCIITLDNYRNLLQSTTAGIWQQYVNFHSTNYNK
jgi:tetratricopeptide (TPR) repeat protein